MLIHNRTFRIAWLAAFCTMIVCVIALSVFLCQGIRLVLSPSNAQQIQKLGELEESVRQIQWRHDGKQVAFVGWEQPVDIRDGSTLAPLHKIGVGRKLIDFAFGPVSSIVAYSENQRNIEILDTRAGNLIELDAPRSQWKGAFSPDEKLLAAGSYGTSITIWDVTSASILCSLDVGRHEGGLTPVFSPDGRILAVGNRNAMTYLFDVATRKVLHVLPEQQTQGLSFDPKGERLAVAYVHGNVGIWNCADGSLMHMRQTSAAEMYRVNWSPAGDLLVSAGRKGAITVWNPDDMTVIRELSAPEWVIEATFSPDGTRLVTSGGENYGNTDRRVTIWGVRLRDWALGHLGLR